MYNKIGVVDLGFGDSGKGITTSRICMSQTLKNKIVVRSNGGHQSGHTVVWNDKRHIFSQFGSGTLQDIPTYLPETFTVEPGSLLKEWKILEYDLDVNPRLFIDQKAMIVTPWDISESQSRAERTNHGSVGVGFGTTVERNEKHYTLYFQDLFYKPILEAKLKNILENYYSIGDIEWCREQEEYRDFVDSCDELLGLMNVVKTTKKTITDNFQTLIFESGQGVLLDQGHGFFPNVTRSYCTSRNMVEFCGEELDEVYYVTRTYQTRHGNGFMTNEDKPCPVLNFGSHEETNKLHPYQGQFRVTELDIELLKHSLRSDLNYSSNSVRKNLVVTCYDQHKIDVQELYRKLSGVVKFDKVFVSHSPDPQDMVRVEF